MIIRLRLQNIILIENADIYFDSNLNILTGETGAGKSAIMHGLTLALGERTDASVIRKGCDKGYVEAIFELNSFPTLLSDAGIIHEPNQELIISREISSSGKNRAFINNQQVQISLLRKLGEQLAQFVSQHANHQLFSLDYHRNTLDIFGEIEELVAAYKLSFEKENTLKSALEEMTKQQSQRIRDIDRYQNEITELEDACLKENEEEELFEEYTKLVNSQEIREKVAEINGILSELHPFSRTKNQLDSLVQLDSSLSETALSFQTALLELQEISHTMQRYEEKIVSDPERLDFLNDRLALINKLKKKYGESFQEIQSYLKEIKEKLKLLDRADLDIEEMQSTLAVVQAETNKLAQEITKKRKLTSKELEKAISEQLHSLNMPKAQFIIEMSSQNRTSTGDDKVEYFLQANFGENKIALREGASGGEIARVLLALHTLLAGKAKIRTLIFDEIDANIGGETAAIIGDKLKEIGKQHQVICVTHFPQVASRGQHHLQITKLEKDGRTITQITKLDQQQQQKELERMIGAKI